MIDENRMKQNLKEFSFPRLSGTIHEKMAFQLAHDKIKELGLSPLIQKFEFSTFFSRIYPKIGFISGFFLLLLFYLNIVTPIFPIVIISILMVKFCVVDSRMRNKAVLHSFRWVIFFTWPISVPIYLIWSRGMKGIGTTILYVLSFILTFSVPFHLTRHLAFG